MSDEPIHIISLGAGVQSSTMALMAAHGEITPMPKAAIFADTQDEPAEVYQQLKFLETALPFPIWVVCAGHLSKDFLNALRNPQGRCGQPPFFVRNPAHDGTAAADSGGMLWRQCTAEYKLAPIRRKVRDLAKEYSATHVVQWIGISVDEAHRMKDAGVRYISNRYPLVDMRLTRHDCLNWIRSRGYPIPPKSACVFCPYTSDTRWREIKTQRAHEWSRAIAFDRSLREQRVTKVAASIKGELFVHRSMRPLQDVDLSNDEDMGQLSLFGNECEGMCGV